MTTRVLALALGLWLGLASVAAADDCSVCIRSVFGVSANGSATLLVRVEGGGISLPERALAVVMKFEDRQTKCVDVPLHRIAQDGRLATYTGSLANLGPGTYSGQLDLDGIVREIEFEVRHYATSSVSLAVSTPAPIRDVQRVPEPTADPLATVPESVTLESAREALPLTLAALALALIPLLRGRRRPDDDEDGQTFRM